MAVKNNQAYSKVSSIANIESLASLLSAAPSELTSISENIASLWKPGKTLIKQDGTPRHTHDARKPLKAIHENIKNRLLKQVSYPAYILGGISDTFTRRDYAEHAAIHANKAILITEDIKDFFPSTSSATVQNIWQRFFNFHPDVAILLTKLTTYQGLLPQGWKTSGYLANLALWDKEPEFVSQLQQRGLTYSRFMDDITVSSFHPINNKQKQAIVTSIYGMLGTRQYKPKRSKHKITSNNNCMEVTGLNVNSQSPSMPKKKRNNIRAQVYQCEQMFKNVGNSDLYRSRWNAASGHVGTMVRFNPGQAKTLRERLSAIKPRS